MIDPGNIAHRAAARQPPHAYEGVQYRTALRHRGVRRTPIRTGATGTVIEWSSAHKGPTNSGFAAIFRF